MPSEHQFERPDARSQKGRPSGPPRGGFDLLVRAGLAGLLTAFVVFNLVFFLPAFLYGDLGVLIGWGWLSAPAGLVLGPLAGWLVTRTLTLAIRNELASYSPRPKDLVFWIYVIFAFESIIGIALWLVVQTMPNKYG
jgi:hypothetical protein